MNYMNGFAMLMLTVFLLKLLHSRKKGWWHCNKNGWMQRFKQWHNTASL